MLAEAQAAATLTHPHLVNVFDYGESPGPNGERLPFVVMEVVTGPTLADQASLTPWRRPRRSPSAPRSPTRSPRFTNTGWSTVTSSRPT